MKKIISGLLVLGLVVGGYFLLTKKNISDYTNFFPNFDAKEKLNVNDAIGKAKNYGTSVATKTVANLAASAAAKTNEIVSNIIDGVKTQIFNSVKDNVNQKVDSIGVNLGVNVSSPGTAPSETVSPITFTIKIGAPAYFTMRNFQDTAINYEIDWQDGQIEKGSIAKNETKLVFHSWQKAGNYQLNFKITDNKGKYQDYGTSVSVF